MTKTKAKKPELTAGAFAAAASIWKLVERDRSTTAVHLLPDGSIYVAGMYCEARRNGTPLGIKRAMAVSGRHLAGVLALMPDDKKVTLSEARSSLVLTGGGRRAVLRRTHVDGPSPITAPEHKLWPLDDLRRAVRFLAPLTPPAGVPVELIGICMTPDKNGVRLSAADGQTAGRAVIERGLRVKEERIVPAADLLAALSLVGDRGWVGIVKTRNGERCVVRDERTVISMALLNGTYPDLSVLPQKHKHSVPVDRDALGTAIGAARLLDEDGRVVYAVDGGRIRWRVQGQDAGGFRLGGGKTDLPDIEIGLAATYLEYVMDAGDGLTMHYTDERTPVYFVSDETRYRIWLATRAA